MKSVCRINLDLILSRILPKIKRGDVLDIGSQNSPYKNMIKHNNFLRVDIDAKTNPDILGSIYDFEYTDDSFDTVLATEILEHLNKPKEAVSRLYRLLKKGGTCVLTTRFIQKYHPSPNDYYRYTEDSLREIFSEFEEVKVIYQGNRLTAIWMMLDSRFAPFVKYLNPLIARINVKKTNFPLGFVVVARK